MLRKPICAFALAATAAMGATSAAMAQEDGAITIVIQNEPLDLDPCTIGHPFNGYVTGQNVIETLTTLDPVTGVVTPKLAVSWEPQGGGTYLFELRPGVTFHDGTPFNAEAVKTAIDRLKDRTFTCAGIINKIQEFEIDAKVIDEDTIELTAADAPMPLPHYMSGFGIGAVSTPADDLARAPVGTGPYSFEDWVQGDAVDLARFDGYWGEAPEVEHVTYVFRQEANLRAIMVQTGEADIAVHVAPQDATNPKTDFAYPNKETTRIRMIMSPPLDDIRIRKALNLAFDADALIGTVLSDSVVRATQFISPDVNGYNPDLALWEFDLAEAKRLVQDARTDGVPVETELRLIAHPTLFPNVDEVLQVLAQMWKEAGLNPRIEIMERGQWKKLVNKPYDADRPAMLIQEMHDNTVGDAVITMRNRYHTEGNLSETNDPKIDELIELAEMSDGDTRRNAFMEANRILAEDIIVAVPMYHMVGYMRVGERLDYKPEGFYSAALLPVANVKLASDENSGG